MNFARNRKRSANKAEKAYKEMLEDVKKKKGKLSELESLEAVKEAEIRRINLRLIQSNQLSFPYEGGPLAWPSASKRVTSTFGMRSHPVSGGYRMHSGIDIGGTTTPHLCRRLRRGGGKPFERGLRMAHRHLSRKQGRNSPVHLVCPQLSASSARPGGGRGEARTTYFRDWELRHVHGKSPAFRSADRQERSSGQPDVVLQK